MSGAVLVLNTGSSSIKFTLFDADAGPQRSDRLCEGQIKTRDSSVHIEAQDGNGCPLLERELPVGSVHAAALQVLLDWLALAFAGLPLLAAAHRIVHGGSQYSAPTIIDASVLVELRRLIPLAPLHQPHAIAAVEALQHSHPSLMQIACFDTAFHHTMPEVETRFALPRALSSAGLRRYGFHGLSYEYIASVLPSMLGDELAAGRVIVAHLGAGASLCALQAGRSVATTMSLTPLDGLPMGSRCGSLDPGAVLYLLQEKGMSAVAVADLLYHNSGLLGVSGVSADMQTLLSSAEPNAADAIDLFVYRISREIGSLAAVLGGLDALVFTAGIGEHAAPIRRRVCDDMSWLGMVIDASANVAGGPHISRPESAVSAWVIATDEDAMIMRHSRHLLGLGADK